MHLDIYEPVWFKLGMMIETIELYSLSPVYVTLTFIQAHRDARKLELLQSCQSILMILLYFWGMLVWWT